MGLMLQLLRTELERPAYPRGFQVDRHTLTAAGGGEPAQKHVQADLQTLGEQGEDPTVLVRETIGLLRRVRISGGGVSVWAETDPCRL